MRFEDWPMSPLLARVDQGRPSTARRASQAGSGSFFGPERLAVPPHHAGVNVDDEPPARRVARVAADRPRVGHAGTGGEPVVRLARDRPHRARSGAVVTEEGRFMRMATNPSDPNGRPGRILAADASVRNPSRGWRG